MVDAIYSYNISLDQNITWLKEIKGRLYFGGGSSFIPRDMAIEG